MRKAISVIPSGVRDLLFGTTPSRQITVPTVRREFRRCRLHNKFAKSKGLPTLPVPAANSRRPQIL
jgi:hypothetical protein